MIQLKRGVNSYENTVYFNSTKQKIRSVFSKYLIYILRNAKINASDFGSVNKLSVTDSVNFIGGIDADLDRSSHAFETLLSTVKFLRIPQTNLHGTCRELRILPSPLVAWELCSSCSRFSFDSPTFTLTSVAHTADTFRETHHNDGRLLWRKAKQLPASLQN